ncbi:MAG TPA: Spy/CpxP family protein refolding chaperone [Xanthobacteraceae bacterium]|nr:Spy/CpxP family protein refolding chaperone [Xanthobacteraceae bacterium]
MWKKATVVASALAIAGSAMVYAQQRGDESGGFGGSGRFGGRGQMGMSERHLNADDLRAFSDARIAALHAGLGLNADQEKSWPPVEQALHDLAKIRIDRATAGREGQQAGTPIDRLQRQAAALTARGTALKHLADAAAPLYQSLDDAQKRRLTVLARMLRPHHGMRHRFGMMGRDRMDGRGGDDLRPYHDDRRMHGDGMRGDHEGGGDEGGRL